MQNSELNDYWNRVGLVNSEFIQNGEKSLQFLKIIHQAQHRHIPFENFDIVLGNEVKISAKNMQDKLLSQQRGGYCFELNGLLLDVLQTIGFSVRPLLGRVHLSGEPSGRTHQISLVELEGEQWIVDAGFGSQTPREPIPLVLNQEFSTDLQVFRIIESRQFGVMLQVKDQQDWQDLYSLDLAYVCQADIEMGNYFTSTNSKSVFTGSRIAAKPTKNGIVTLLNSTLKVTSNGVVEETILPDDERYVEALEQYFGIVLNHTYQDFKF
ncbi:arylamine N-acetyltransferase [Vibrio sinensis]|uniref:Arylamine N-acetyltransferase n=1 Tax=Vibrio sinensis TaxID=2302434 RepID=A0A3A6RGA1_9VIBR|nr:arylamine N-acetyltransferase [Vibrio sinensis]RJX75741.1 arylamine N-acetyltransferase [Vibrio sinensis]